jgi:hypothetical protein
MPDSEDTTRSAGHKHLNSMSMSHPIGPNSILKTMCKLIPIVRPDFNFLYLTLQLIFFSTSIHTSTPAKSQPPRRLRYIS